MVEAHYARLLKYIERRIDLRLQRRAGADAVLHEAAGGDVLQGALQRNEYWWEKITNFGHLE